MIIQFPTKARVVIISRLVKETRRVTGNGSTNVRHDPPIRMFFLDYEDTEGSCGVWDGESYLGALAAASDWAADDVEVRDRVAETWGRS